MTINKCTCGEEGLHPHTIDNKNYTLCGQCHSVIVVLKVNSLGLPIPPAILTATKDEKGNTYFDRIALIPPDINAHVKELTNNEYNKAISPPVTQAVFPVQPIINESEIQSFFIPIEQDDNELMRIPFVIPTNK